MADLNDNAATAADRRAAVMAPRQAVLDAVASMAHYGLRITEGMSINLVFDRFQVLDERFLERGRDATARLRGEAPDDADLARGLKLIESELEARSSDDPALQDVAVDAGFAQEA